MHPLSFTCFTCFFTFTSTSTSISAPLGCVPQGKASSHLTENYVACPAALGHLVGQEEVEPLLNRDHVIALVNARVLAGEFGKTPSTRTARIMSNRGRDQ